MANQHTAPPFVLNMFLLKTFNFIRDQPLNYTTSHLITHKLY